MAPDTPPTLITGGRGFIGRRLTEALWRSGRRVICYDRIPPQTDDAQSQRGIRHVTAEVGDGFALRTTLRSQMTVYHLAGATYPRSGADAEEEEWRLNVSPTLTLLREAVQARVRRIVLLSSGGTVYGVPHQLPIPETHPTEPICAYGISKLAIEKYLTMYGLRAGIEVRIARAANPYGPGQDPHRGQGAIPAILRRLADGEPVDLFGETVRDYFHVNDLVRGLLLLADDRGPYRVYNLSGGRGILLSDLLRRLEQTTGRKAVEVRRHRLPATDVKENVLDPTRAREALGWEVEIEIEDGLKEVWEWIRQT